MMRIMARGDEGSDGCGITFEVARQTAVATDPGECPFHDPSLGQDFETGSMGSLHDFQLPCTGAPHDQRHLVSGISAIGKNALDERVSRTSPALVCSLRS